MQDTLTAAVKSAPSKSALKALRVLFLPKNSRTSYFRSFLEAAFRREAWDLRVVCAEASRKTWRHAVAGDDCFHSVPDFGVPQDWEKDADRVAAIDAFIAECEQATGISAGRIVLAGERDIGRGFSKPIYYWFHNRIARNVMRDNAEPFRIVRRMFAFARSVLEAAPPDLVIAGEWADPMCFTFYLAARRLGIRCAANRYSKVWSGRCFWSSGMLMYNDLGRAKSQTRRDAQAPISDHSRDHIAAFRSKPKMVGYLKAIWDKIDRTNWWNRHVELARHLAVEIRHHVKRYGGPPPKPALRLLFDFYRRQWLEWRNARFFRSFDDESLERTRYIYLPLHKDPEQALNYQAPFWVYQLSTVELASSSLPAGYKLMVREHRTNPSRRSPRFYKQLASIPGVVLIDGYDSQFKYLKHADLVLTENGASAWEGLLLGRRVITLTECFFDGANLGLRVRDPELLSRSVLEILDNPAVEDDVAYDHALGCYLDAEWETSAPLEPEGHVRALELLAELQSLPAEVAPNSTRIA